MTLSTASAFPSAQGTERVSTRRVWLFGLLAALAASAANVVLFFLGSALGTLTPDVMIDAPAGPEPLTPVQVIRNSFLGAVLATVLFAAITRFARRPIRAFRIVAVVVLVLSFAMPVTIRGAPLPYILTLELMHVIAALIIVSLLTSRAREST